jgi:putative transcriptional regulator
MEFSEKVKEARKKVNFSQEDMAHQLGVSFATVNRWESGKTKPSKLALKAFEDFCKENSIVFEREEA